MDSPFVYNRFVTGKNFIGRKNDATILANMLSQGTNIAIYEGARTGKKSTIQQALFNLRLNGTQFIAGELSLLNTRSLADLVTKLASTAIKMSGAATPYEFADLAGRYLQGTHLVFDEIQFSTSGRIISLNWDPDQEDLRAAVRLPYLIAREKEQKAFLIMGEFQNIMLIEDGDAACRTFAATLKEIEPELRGNCSYIMYGSQVNAMKEIFEHHKYFYRQVEHFSLKPIEAKDITDHIVKGFLASGKVIDRDLLQGVCALFKGHIGYINHFSSICDSLSKGYIMEPVLVESLENLLAIHEPRFIAIMNDLTTFQVGLLRAIMEGNTKFSSADVIERYGLNSSANVRRLKDALCKKEIITFNEKDEPQILDPLFEHWVGRYFYELKSEQ